MARRLRSVAARMTELICFGLGYCAEHFVAAFGERFAHIEGTVRSAERTAVLNKILPGRLQALQFDGVAATADLEAAIARAGCALISIPPNERGDPVLACAGEALARAERLRAIVYLSTVGVYGDHGGAWVDEDTPPQPRAARSRHRLAAEAAWQELGAQLGIAVAILRLAGIYGPGQDALVRIARGDARRIVKPGQVFNHIHVADIAQAIAAALTQNASGIFNIADDEPCPQGDPLAFAAALLQRQAPPEVTFAEAAPAMSPMARSFWQDCRRVRNERLKRMLGVKLLYPTYREGLQALLAAGFSLDA
jgi:nucleoside-diphosphate-sugar epimerase